MSIRVAYDIATIANEFGKSDRKSGVYRVTEEIMHELNQIDTIDFSVIGVCSYEFFFSALKAALYLQSDPNLRSYKFVDILESRLGLRKFYDRIYAIYSSDNFWNLPKYSLQSISIKGLFKLLRDFDAYNSFNPDNFDIFHSSYHKLPPIELTKKLPRVLTIHDLIPVITPELTTPWLTQYFREILNSINLKSDWIICNSEFTKQEFCDYTKTPIERTFVTPFAASNHFYPVKDALLISQIRQRYGISEGDYFLSLATHLEPRKNLNHLVRCFFRLLSEHPNLDVNLVLAGSKRSWSGEIANDPKFAKFQSKLHFTGYVSDEDLNAIYSGATAFIYPSLYEGFGLPTLEAMKCGTPVIASNRTSIPEVVGEAGILIDPQDEDALCQAMLNLLKDGSIAQDLREKGFERSQQFSWAKCAAETVEVYKKVVNSQQ
jgi:glycosyltransferase involved in cell wall biosynthesis